MKKYLLLLLLLISNGIFSQSKSLDLVSVKLISELNTIAPAQEFYVGIKLKMLDEWHTYWKNPGDAGLATRIKWNLPSGFSASEIFWPYPKRFYLGDDMVNFGYDNEEILLVKISTPKILAQSDYLISAKVSWLACKEECVPGSQEVSIKLKADSGSIYDSVIVKEIEETFLKLPVEFHDYKFSAERKDSLIILTILVPESESAIERKIKFYPYENGIFDYAYEQPIESIQNGYKLILKLDEMKIKNPKDVRGIIVSNISWITAKNSKALGINVSLNNYEEKK